MATLLRATAIWVNPAGKSVTTGWDFESNLDITQSNLVDISNRAAVEWAGGVLLREKFSTDLTLDSVEAFSYDIVVNPDPPPASPFRKQLVLGPVSSPSGVAGTVVPISAPPQAALVVTHVTQISTRRTRGRGYLPPPPADFIEASGTINEPYRADMELRMTNFVTAMENSATPPQTYTHSVVSLQAASLITPVTQYLVRGRIDTQRRRLSRSLDV